MDLSTLSFLFSALLCLTGLAGWLYRREGQNRRDSEWRGTISAKLDNILDSVGGHSRELERLNLRLGECTERLARTESGLAQLTRRLDRHSTKKER